LLIFISHSVLSHLPPHTAAAAHFQKYKKEVKEDEQRIEKFNWRRRRCLLAAAVLDDDDDDDDDDIALFSFLRLHSAQLQNK
jgi:hypothetical protein